MWADPNYWYDDSPAVPCSKPHTTETVFVYELAHPTPHAALQVEQECHDHIRGYVGISDDTWIPWGNTLLLPSKEQIADGASWVRCDMYFPAATGKAGPRDLPYRGLDAAVHPPVALWGCLDHLPDRARSQPYVSCAAPHVFEATGDIIHTPPTSTYPTRRVRDHAARQCDRHVPHGAGLAPAVMWGAAVEGPDLSGACLFRRSDGQPLPPRS